MIVLSVLTSALTRLYAQTDPNSLSLMGTPLEGPIDSVTVRLQAAAWTPWGHSDDGEDYYFRGNYYGIRAKLMLTITPRSRLVASAYVTIGPYSTQKMLERNRQYFSYKLKQTLGEPTERDGALVFMNDYGSVKLSVVDNGNGSNDIHVLYVPDGAFYKDALSMGFRGLVQDVVTENAISEDQFLRFSADGQIENPDLQSRQYDAYGYLRQARMTEKEGYSMVYYDYDSQRRLRRRSLENPVAGVRYVNEYTYNERGEVSTESQKVYEQSGECVLTIDMRYTYLTRDDHDNWTTNTLTLTYWEKDTQSQRTTVMQKRTLTYWE